MIALTAYTGLSFSLFQHKGNYVVTVEGIDNEQSKSELLNLIDKRYNWVGHTHPGDSIVCIYQLEFDYMILNLLCQGKSTIYNSIGQSYTFKREKTEC